MGLNAYLRGVPSRANGGGWFLEWRPVDAPPGTPWVRLPQRFDGWAEVEAEVTAPTDLLRPGDLARFGSGHQTTHWAVGYDGRGRRLPMVLDLVQVEADRRALAHHGDDWAGAWDGADDAALLLALAAGAGVARGALVAAGLAAARPDLARVLGADETTRWLATLDAWLAGEGDAASLRETYHAAAARYFNTTRERLGADVASAWLSIAYFYEAALGPEEGAGTPADGAREAAMGALLYSSAQGQVALAGPMQAVRPRAALPLSALLAALDLL